MNKQFSFWGVALLGAAFVVGGLVVLALGLHAFNTVHQSLVDENLMVQDPAILLTYEGAHAPEGVTVPTILVDTEKEAEAQARVIHEHTMGITGGKTYAEMGRDDPARATYITSLTLQSSLYLAEIGLELSQFVIGVGVAFAGLGAAILVIGLPLTRKLLALK